MSRIDRVSHEFVDSFPTPMQSGVLYISLPYKTAGHLCCCGCGQEVVTPLSPTDWKLIFDGETASLHPSIGSWTLPCRSHYFISRGQVEWSGAWSRDRVAAAQAQDRRAKRQYFSQREATAPAEKAESTAEPAVTVDPVTVTPVDEQEMPTSLWLRLRNLG